MALIEIADGYVLNMDQFNTSILISASGYTETSRLFAAYYGAGDACVLTGSGFIYDLSGFPTAGVVTSVGTYIDGSVVSIFDQISVKATDIVNAALTFGNSDDLALLAKALAGADSISGADGNDLLRGYDGNDHLYGGTGNDSLFGGSGADVMSGGKGNDTYVVDNTGDKAVEAAGAANGIDRVLTSISYTLAANLENLATTSATGTSAINLTGNALANTITGNAGANVIRGGAGSDILVGGKGHDTLAGNTTTAADDVARDSYKFSSTSDSGVTSATQDIIWGHFGGATGDRIDLSAVPTGSSAASFTFITGSFTARHPGQARVIASGADHIVQVNTDADAAPEMTILIHSNSHIFAASDFVL